MTDDKPTGRPWYDTAVDVQRKRIGPRFDFGKRPAQWVHTEYHGGVPRYGVDYGRTHKAAVERRRAILNADFAAIEARILAYAHYHNPAPYYSWFCSAMTRSAVHKANVAVDEYYDHSHIVTRWLALSYATDRGIVFG